MCNAIADIEKRALDQVVGAWGFDPPGVLSVMAWGGDAWARAILVLRAAMVLHLEDELRDAASPDEAMIDHFHAEYGRPSTPTSSSTPPPWGRRHRRSVTYG